ncbi:hypothetical protein VTN96DRAFT_3468 [Rasamsonia emersonii]
MTETVMSTQIVQLPPTSSPTTPTAESENPSFPMKIIVSETRFETLSFSIVYDDDSTALASPSSSADDSTTTETITRTHIDEKDCSTTSPSETIYEKTIVSYIPTTVPETVPTTVTSYIEKEITETVSDLVTATVTDTVRATLTLPPINIMERITQTEEVSTTETAVERETATVTETETLAGNASIISEIVTVSEEVTDTATLSAFPITENSNPESTMAAIPAEEKTTATPTLSSLTLCPSLIANPTYTPAAPLPKNYTWGCPPGHLCHPPKPADCNFEAGPPADSYYCSPDECIPSPEPLFPAQFWGQPVVSDQIGRFVVSPGYFNLDPAEFGLSDDIFVFNLQKRDYPQLLRHRQRPRSPPSTIPGVCYDECNNVLIEAEWSGKTPALCQKGSAFTTYLADCRECIEAHGSSSSSSSGETLGDHVPEFQQFLSYCDSLDEEYLSSQTSGSSSGAEAQMDNSAPPSAATITDSASASAIQAGR